MKIIPLASALETLHYRLIRYPKDLKTISAKYPNAREHEEVLSLLQEIENEHESLINEAKISYQNKIAEIYLTHLQEVEQKHENLINEAKISYQNKMAEIHLPYITFFVSSSN